MNGLATNKCVSISALSPSMAVVKSRIIGDLKRLKLNDPNLKILDITTVLGMIIEEIGVSGLEPEINSDNGIYY